METRRFGIAALIGASLLAGNAAAVDGVIEINQTCAVQTGCHPSDTPGFPVRIPIGASYRLTSDLVIGDGDLTVIQGFVPASPIGGGVSSNGTLHLDLNGHSIRCFLGLIVPVGASCDGTGIGVDFSTISGATVENGSVRNMGNDGIVLGTAGRVRDVYVNSNGQSTDANIAGIRCGNGCQISRCVAEDNGRYGFFTGAGSSVVDSQMLLNDLDGARVGAGSLVARNAIYANVGRGITDSSGSGIFQNAINGNGGLGIDSLVGAPFAYGQNALRTNNGGGAEVSALGVQVNQNFCETDTICP